MRKLLMLAGTFGLLAGGCSHYAERRAAEYHQAKADRAARHGNYYKAAREERKADIDRERAAEAPLP
jgi:hypothetical protein